MYDNLDDALATYFMLLRGGDVEPWDALRSVQEDCTEGVAEELAIAVCK